MAVKEQIESQRLSVGVEGIEVERVYTLLWSERFTADLPQLGDLFDGELPSGLSAANVNLVAVDAAVERYGGLHARYRVVYRTYYVPTLTNLTDQSSGVTLALGHEEKLFYGTSGTSQVVATVIIPTATITVRTRTTDSQIRSMARVLGHINSTRFMGLETNTVLYVGTEQTRTGGVANGLLTGNVWLASHTFLYKRATYGWDTAYTSSGAPTLAFAAARYPTANLYTVLS
jgi:hypothetical protein